MKFVWIEFVTPEHNGILSYIIRKIIKRPYSHCRLIWFGTERKIIFEAAGSYVKMYSEEFKFKPVNVVKEYYIPLSPEQIERHLSFVCSVAGTRYNMYQLVGIGLAKLFNWKKNYLGRRGMVCSELVARWLEFVFNIRLAKDLNLITPADIDDFLKEFEYAKN